MNTRNLALSGLFVAIMLILGYLEKVLSLGWGYGIKLGLSNCVLLLCLYWFGVGNSLLLMVAKVFLAALLFGGLNAITLSLSLGGGILSMAGMILLVFVVKDVSPVGAGMVGGVLHNVGQLLVAILLHRFPVLYTYMALLVVIGAVMGAITGSLVLRLKHFLPYERRQRFGFAGKKEAPRTS
ncbi:MAG: Gx transporter family protein [Clostridiales bacterium]|nr:Gx transporter family protein [Clostridiales bacterium]